MDIEHYWYKKWGAGQLPQDTNGVITFLQEVNEAKKSKHGPVVVHCKYNKQNFQRRTFFDVLFLLVNKKCF